MLIMPSFQKSLIVEQFQGNYLKQIGLVNHSYDYRPNWTPRSPVTITYFRHMSADPGLHFNTDLSITFSILLTEHPPINKIVDKGN